MLLYLKNIAKYEQFKSLVFLSTSWNKMLKMTNVSRFI